MEVFEKFCEFYVENKFTDLCVVSGQDNDQVFCHSLILTSAVPGLKDLLRDSHESQEDRSTIILSDISGLELKEAVSDIYNSLIQDVIIESDRIEYWANAFGVPLQALFNKSDLLKLKTISINDKPKVKRKRKRRRIVVEDVQVDVDDNFPSLSFPKQSKLSKSKKKKQKNDKTETGAANQHRFQVKQELDELDDYSANYYCNDVNENDGANQNNFGQNENDQNGNDQNRAAERKEIMQEFLKRLDQAGTDSRDELFLKEEREDDVLGEIDYLDVVPPQYDTSPINDEEQHFDDLADLSDAILSGKQQHLGKLFQATTFGVYLRSDLNTFIPKVTDQFNEDPHAISLVPKAAFVALFAVGIRDDLNIAKPIAYYHESYPASSIIHNFVTVIKQLTGVSSRSILECSRHQSQTVIEKDKRVKKIHVRVKGMSPDEREMVLAENERYHEEQEQSSQRLDSNPLPEKHHLLKFQLVNFLESDAILDYLIVYGDHINSLIVQTFAKPVKTKSGIAVQLPKLIDAMAAFSRVESATDLFKVRSFKNLIESHYDRVCETLTLKILKSSRSSTSQGFKPRRKVAICPDCKLSFNVRTVSEKRNFESHKLSHVGCNCNINFLTDNQYRAHMKSVHLQKKKFKCAFGSCNQYFSSQLSLEKHYHLIHEKSLEDGVGVICAICGQTFVNQHYLKAHHLCYHKEFPCNQCGEVIYGKNAQEKHHRDVHATFDDHLCQHCGKGFKMKKYLHIHIINAHTLKQDKPFPCHLCEKGFNNHMKLTQHLDGVHYKRKPYKCRAGGDVCNMAFSAQSTRKRHEKVAHKLDIRLPQGRKSTSKVAQGSELEKLM